MASIFALTLAVYAVACVLYLEQLVAGAPHAVEARLERAARLSLAVAFVAHSVEISALCIRGIHPFLTVRETLSFISWLTVGAYLVTTVRWALPLAGALIVPVALVLEVAARVGPTQLGATGHAATVLGRAHIGLATAGVAVFAVAAGDAAVYLLAERQLKGRGRARTFSATLPPLETLDRINRRCIQLGFPLFTVAMITGSMWLMRIPDGGVHRLLRPQYAMSVLAWTLYAALLLLRLVAGWRGRRAAIVTLGGFGASLGVLLIYYVRGYLGA
jgi:ABC-type uncharacterized transport system permease subunit